MARQQTRSKVHEAVLSLARESRVGTITMEGIAARAGVSKQTLYRTWPSTGVILFEALLARSAGEDGAVAVPDSGNLATDLEALATATIAELTDPTHEPLLRAVTAEMLADEALEKQFRELLLGPQLVGISDRLCRGGLPDPDDIAELFVGPIFHRWLLRSRPFDSEWVRAHVARTLRGASTE
ncbi:TetR/AcrR family transcriptional regulator [Rhodococcus spongiicola]|uniref:TetR/AcrR family transcriptional regulator n=1 Tax=Rhodococcus spongiicola TaxID=2487352 RepID=A0A438AUY9_9NOCA|nr:TetR/AcrR family transcriptional regulator [Rhodococcus spongiicola]RVW02422.1 TetR/AcrR family transcriptional regulator [Rhodococcus spongiicola]